MCKFTITFDREDDGRFIAEVQEIPGALAYGATQAEAKAKVQAIILRSLATQVERGEYRLGNISFHENKPRSIKQLLGVFLRRLKNTDSNLYNEKTLQMELGVFLKTQLPKLDIKLECDVTSMFPNSFFSKKELDILISDSDRHIAAIEIKYPRRGRVPEFIYDYCKDICFVEQLKLNGVQFAAALFFTDDNNFFQGSKNDSIYSHFRGLHPKPIHGTIEKPTGPQAESVTVNGNYSIRWKSIMQNAKYNITIV